MRYKNCTILFREPFPMFTPSGSMVILASVNGKKAKEIEVEDREQQKVVTRLLNRDKKLTDAKVKSTDGKWRVVKHSPQTDFLEMVKEQST
jgi:hypothetical protein